MKKILFTTALVFALASCEDPIHVDTDTAAPRLVIDAAINWEKGTPGNEQVIKLTTTTDYFNANPPVVSGATVRVANSVGTVFDFVEEPGTGRYVCTGFIPEIGQTYTLTVVQGGRTITATETLQPAPPIEYVTQETIPGIQQEGDQIEFKAYFTDPADRRDFYLVKYQSSVTAIPEFVAVDDEFFNGNQVFALYLNEDLEPGGLLGIKLYGVSERYFHYWEKLINLAGINGPFSTPGGVLRGNLVNTTHPDDYVLGYFSCSETSEVIYDVGPY